MYKGNIMFFTIAREIRCEVANFLLKFKKIIIIEKIIKKFVINCRICCYFIYF